MKNLYKYFLLIVLVPLIQSCMLSRNQEFSVKKYTHFKKGETAILDKEIQQNNKLVLKENSVNKNNVNEMDNLSQQKVESAIAIKTEIADSSEKQEDCSSQFSNKTAKQDKKEVVNTENIQNTSEVYYKKPYSKKYFNKNIIFHSNTTSISGDINKIFLIVMCFLLPPLAVYYLRGSGKQFWNALLLTCLLWLPGVLYALIIIIEGI